MTCYALNIQGILIRGLLHVCIEFIILENFGTPPNHM